MTNTSLPIVDIIIPNYNKGKFLKKCLESVFNQSHKKWNLIIVDDNSNDSSLHILKEFKNKKKIKIIRLTKNKGPSFCRNLGIENSNNNYIAFLDSDDIWKPNKLYDQLIYMIQNKYNFTYSDYCTFYENEKKNFKKNSTNLKDSFNYDEFILNSSINSSTMIVKRKILKGIKFKSLALLEDYIFKCQILKKNFTAKKINKVLAYYRVHKDNRSKNKFNNLLFLWRVNKKYNKLNFLRNLKSLIFISFNSIKKYHLQK
jgi:teichuronic acid biosynthesis glycosyltransferase TuaG